MRAAVLGPLLGAVLVFVVVAIAHPRERVVIVERPADPSLAVRYWRSPVLRVTKNELVMQGELIATVESVLRDDSPTFRIDALRERLEAGMIDLPSHVRKVHLDHEACQAARDRQLDQQLLCPGRTLIVQIDDALQDAHCNGDLPPCHGTNDRWRLLGKIINTTYSVGFHAAVTYGPTFPQREPEIE